LPPIINFFDEPAQRIPLEVPAFSVLVGDTNQLLFRIIVIFNAGAIRIGTALQASLAVVGKVRFAPGFVLVARQVVF